MFRGFVDTLCKGQPWEPLLIFNGAKSALSGITRALILLVVILGVKESDPKYSDGGFSRNCPKSGIDILDWSFLKRAHAVSLKGANDFMG